MTPKKKKKAKFSHFKMEMRPKKIFPCKLCPSNIDVIFKHRNTSCTLLKLVYIILNNMIIYNFIFICNGTIFSISEHVEWILRWLELLFFNTNVIFLIMIFHKTNTLSFNITWVHNKTLNVIPIFKTKLLMVELFSVHYLQISHVVHYVILIFINVYMYNVNIGWNFHCF